MYRDLIERLVETCERARRGGLTAAEVRARVLPQEAGRLLGELSAADFLDWVKEDPEFNYYYYDVQQSGACAKAREAAAMILESIAADAVEEG